MGWAIAGTPSEATVLAALGVAVRRDDERGPFAGVPHTIRPDGGLEFAAEIMSSACGTLGIYLFPTLPTAPTSREGGAIPRHASRRALAELPHFTDGPRDAAGAVGDGVAGAHARPARYRFAGFDRWYNADRPHAGLNGQTPLQRWQEDAAPLTAHLG